jgi:hypothetical protein
MKRQRFSRKFKLEAIRVEYRRVCGGRSGVMMTALEYHLSTGPGSVSSSHCAIQKSKRTG